MRGQDVASSSRTSSSRAMGSFVVSSKRVRLRKQQSRRRAAEGTVPRDVFTSPFEPSPLVMEMLSSVSCEQLSHIAFERSLTAFASEAWLAATRRRLIMGKRK